MSILDKCDRGCSGSQVGDEDGFYSCNEILEMTKDLVLNEIPLDITKTYDKIISDSDNQMTY